MNPHRSNTRTTCVEIHHDKQERQSRIERSGLDVGGPRWAIGERRAWGREADASSNRPHQGRPPLCAIEKDAEEASAQGIKDVGLIRGRSPVDTSDLSARDRRRTRSGRRGRHHDVTGHGAPPPCCDDDAWVDWSGGRKHTRCEARTASAVVIVTDTVHVTHHEKKRASIALALLSSFRLSPRACPHTSRIRYSLLRRLRGQQMTTRYDCRMWHDRALQTFVTRM